MLEWLSKTEPLWLFIILAIEMFMGVYTAVILTIEFNYDKMWNEQLKEAKKRRKKLDYEEMCQGEHK